MARIKTGSKLSTSGGNINAARAILKKAGIEGLAAYAAAHGWPTKFYLPDGERIGNVEAEAV